MSEVKELSHEDVLKMVSSYMNDEHVALVERAYHFAAVCHPEISDENQVSRISFTRFKLRESYADLHMDPETVCAGYLHDIVEDTGATLDDIKELFGPTIALIVDGDTKLGKIQYQVK